MHRLFLIISFLLFFATYSEAATYHVKKTGSNSHTCTQAQNSPTPKLTISSAFACIGTASGAGAGHTVRVYVGTYVESLVNNMPGGSDENNRFVFEGNLGDVVTVRPSGAGQHGIYLTGDKHKYITIQNVDLDGVNTTTSYGVFAESTTHHIITQDLTIKNFGNHSGFLGGGHHMIWRRVVFDNNGNTCATGALLCHGLYSCAADSINEYNVFSNNGGFGSHIYSNVSCERIITRYNVAFGNGSWGFLQKGPTTLMHNNISYNNDGGINTISGSNVYNNTVTGNRLAFQCNFGTLTAKNNIIFGNTTNTIVGVSGCNVTTNVSNNLFTDPSFVNAAGTDFRLRASSAAIDAGGSIPGVTTDITGAPRPQGLAWDIGAYEYTASGNSLPPSPSNLSVGAALP